MIVVNSLSSLISTPHTKKRKNSLSNTHNDPVLKKFILALNILIQTRLNHLCEWKTLRRINHNANYTNNIERGTKTQINSKLLAMTRHEVFVTTLIGWSLHDVPLCHDACDTFTHAFLDICPIGMVCTRMYSYPTYPPLPHDKNSPTPPSYKIHTHPSPLQNLLGPNVSRPWPRPWPRGQNSDPGLSRTYLWRHQILLSLSLALFVPRDPNTDIWLDNRQTGTYYYLWGLYS